MKRTGGKRPPGPNLVFDFGCGSCSGIDSESLLLSILSLFKSQRAKGTQARILLEVDPDEIIFITIPEELVEFLDKVQHFPSRLDFFFIFHVFLLFC